ncbi:hypothetical protein MRB53_038283 [Persea americana]|nr:hypothetical protein MRB53_038283 [Persea americana]
MSLRHKLSSRKLSIKPATATVRVWDDHYFNDYNDPLPRETWAPQKGPKSKNYGESSGRKTECYELQFKRHITSSSLLLLRKSVTFVCNIKDNWQRLAPRLMLQASYPVCPHTTMRMCKRGYFRGICPAPRNGSLIMTPSGRGSSTHLPIHCGVMAKVRDHGITKHLLISGTVGTGKTMIMSVRAF